MVYRVLANTSNPKPKKKKSCWFFHYWTPQIKPEKETEILFSRSNLSSDGERKIYYINVFEDYVLVCDYCSKEKEMGINFTYMALAMDDARHRFKHGELVSIPP